MKKNHIPSILFLLLVFIVSACTYTAKIKDSKTAIDRKQYALALQLGQKEMKTAKTRLEKGRIAYRIAESYRHINQPEKSVSFYKTAYDNGVGVDALREYAYALKNAEQYAEAAEAFKNLGIEIGSPYEYKKEIAGCEMAQKWLAEPEKTGYSAQISDFNSSNADYAPTLYENNQLLITSDRNSNTGKNKTNKYAWTGNAFSDFFTVDRNTNSVKLFENELINTPFNEGTATFNSDFTEMYFSRCGIPSEAKGYLDSYCQIMQSKRKNGEPWQEAEAMPFTKEKVNYAQPMLSADGKTLFFAANDPEGWGGYDIFVVKRPTTQALFEDARILPRSINTQGNESFPTLDGDTLYFSSDYLAGMGGMDIYKTYPTSATAWATPQNLKAPINSSSDDMSYTVDRNAAKIDGVLQQGFFVSSRKGGKGSDDIYRFEKRLPPPPPVVVVVDTPKATEKPKPIEYKILLEGYVLEKIYADASNPNSAVLGRKPLNGSSVTISIGKQKKQVTVGEDGLFSLELQENSDYNFFASNDGYLSNQTNFTTKGLGKDPANPVQKYEVEIVLDKIFKDKEITLQNIYYDYDKSDIREDAKPTLDELSSILFQNPNIKIQLASHTDCRGNDDYNASLSQRRAESAVNYLISRSIESNRLVAKGYGESSPAVSCECKKCTESENQANRRTTFKILE